MPPDRADVHEILAFEAPAPLAPGAWGGGAGETLAVDDAVTHRGDHSGRITRDTASPDDFSALNFHLPVDFTGAEIELSGWLRLEDVSGSAGLWLREDGGGRMLEFGNLDGRIQVANRIQISPITRVMGFPAVSPRARAANSGDLFAIEGSVLVAPGLGAYEIVDAGSGAVIAGRRDTAVRGAFGVAICR